MKEYTEEFYKMMIRSKHQEMDREKVDRYINGLGFNIQDEMSMLKISTVEESYQYSLKAEDIVKRRQQNNPRGREICNE